MKRDITHLLCAVVLVSSCRDNRTLPEIVVNVTTRDSAGVRIADLPMSPTDLLRASVVQPKPSRTTLEYDAHSGVVAANVTVLSPDLTIGGADSGFGSIIDVAPRSDGWFAVFDRAESIITVFDSTGQVVQRLGGKGTGPGEFVFPLALTWVDSGLVAWDARPVAFTLFDRDGKLIRAARSVIEGDWRQHSFRRPHVDLEGYQTGLEDITRRLERFGPDGFIHQLQVDENAVIGRTKVVDDIEHPPVFLVRYGLDLRPRDTLAILNGPASRISPDVKHVAGVLPQYEQYVFDSRPLWTTGDGWWAVGHGDSSAVVVRSATTNDTIMIIRWPRQRVDVSEDDKIEAALWILRVRDMNSSESHELIQRASRAQMIEAVEGTALELTRFAKKMPLVAAMYGAGRCLFVTGASSADHLDGTGLTWFAINVASGSVNGMIRIPRRGASVRGFTTRHAYVVFRDANGSFFVERYPLPPMDC